MTEPCYMLKIADRLTGHAHCGASDAEAAADIIRQVHGILVQVRQQYLLPTEAGYRGGLSQEVRAQIMTLL